MIRIAPPPRLLGLAALCVALGGCGGNMDDLKQRVAGVKAQKSQQIEPIPQIKQFESFAYVPGDRRDPFKKVLPEPGSAPVSGGGPRPDTKRVPEPLEEFPLDSLRMQGIIETPRAVFALVTAPDGVIHRVTIGNHMGHNYGRINAISETAVSLSEIVPDGFGGWKSRPATLALVE